MKNRIYEALDEIKAENKLKQDTYAFLQNKINRKKKVAFKRFAVAFASVILLFIAGLFSHNLYFAETAFIDIDVNPSIELSLNRFDCVIDVYAYNEDGREVLDNINIKNKSYKDALKILIDQMVEMGYLSDSGFFTATLQIKDGTNEKEWLDSLKIYIDPVLQSQNRMVEQDIFAVDSNTKTHAHKQNLTPAKYLAILELQVVDPTATFDRCRDHTINEIKQQTHEHMNGGHGNENSGHESESGHESVSGNENGANGHDNTQNTESHQQSGNEPDQAPITNHDTNNSKSEKSGEHDFEKQHGNGH